MPCLLNAKRRGYSPDCCILEQIWWQEQASDTTKTRMLQPSTPGLLSGAALWLRAHGIGSYPCIRPTIMRSAPFFRLHSLVGCHTPPADSHSGCVPRAQLAGLHVPPTEGSVHTASLAMAAHSTPRLREQVLVREYVTRRVHYIRVMQHALSDEGRTTTFLNLGFAQITHTGPSSK